MLQSVLVASVTVIRINVLTAQVKSTQNTFGSVKLNESQLQLILVCTLSLSILSLSIRLNNTRTERGTNVGLRV